MTSSFREEVVVPFPAQLPRAPHATHCRSTLLVASVQALRRHGHYARYEALVAREHLEAITSTVAGVWLPIEIAIAHYRACDALALAVDEQLTIGGEVVRTIQRTFIGTLLKLASSGAELSPMVGMQKFAAIYVRTFQGGGAKVVQIGPKDVRTEIVGQPLSLIPYFRVAYRGFIQAGCEFFARRTFVTELPRYMSATTLGYRVSWA
ncbi:MAG: hypothetical protein ACLQVI_00285 [Polyangiaceae bacterium]|jgi:hypothetical protein